MCLGPGVLLRSLLLRRPSCCAPRFVACMHSRGDMLHPTELAHLLHECRQHNRLWWGMQHIMPGFTVQHYDTQVLLDTAVEPINQPSQSLPRAASACARLSL